MSAGDSGTLPQEEEDILRDWKPEKARAVMKDWVCLARDAALGRRIDLPAEIGRYRFGKFASPLCSLTPNPQELEQFSTLSGFAAPDVVQSACAFLHPTTVPRTPPVAFAPVGDTSLATSSELKEWIKHACRSAPDGKISAAKLAAKLGLSHGTVCNWQRHGSPSIPSMDYVELIANACNVPTPTLSTLDIRAVSPRKRQLVSAELAQNLADEILWTGRVLASHAYSQENRERNAEIFLARFGGAGDSGTLQTIGDRHNMTRERVRQIVDKQLLHLPRVKLRTECFDQVAAACEQLQPMGLSQAEHHLRHLLGDGLSLTGAMDFGVEILGRRLPFHSVLRKNLEPFVVPGGKPVWFESAITQAKRLIRHCGAAQFTLAWALTCREHRHWIDPGGFRNVIEHIPGFDWIDEAETWFWLGPTGSANRVVSRTIEILAAAPGPLDVEIIYGGLARYSRGRDSDVADSAGVFPPLEVVRELLSKSPAFHLQQGDDFRLALAPDAIKEKAGVAQIVVNALRSRGGLASRSELYEAAVNGMGVNPVSFSVVLAISPLIRQVDRGIFAIRGWPINGQRLIEAQGTVGAALTANSNLRSVEVDVEGAVSWIGILTEGSLANRYAGIPAKAAPYLPTGEYTVVGSTRKIAIHDDRRIQGLVSTLVDMSATPGTAFRVTVQPHDRSAQVEIIAIEMVESADV